MRIRCIAVVCLCVGIAAPSFGFDSGTDRWVPAVEDAEVGLAAPAPTELGVQNATKSMVLSGTPVRVSPSPSRARLGTKNVLIIQDVPPWTLTSIQDVLTANGISYDQITSSQIAVTDLSLYRMVVIPSVQGDPYVGAWNASIGAVEHYVQQGGRLWLSTANHSGDIDLLVPGGVVSSFALDQYNDIVDPGHPWVQGVPSPIDGFYMNHNEFAALLPGTTVVAVAQTSGNPVLIDYAFGAGRVLATGQPLEYAWDAGWAAGPILENSLLDMFNSFVFSDVLVIQDSLPWGLDEIHDVLTSNGIAYDVINSSQIGAFSLSRYKLVVVPSVQGTSFYTAWNANIAWIEDFVAGGGRLWLSACNFGGTPVEALIPGGVVVSNDDSPSNDLADPAHRWVAGVPNPMGGTSASHDSFTSLLPGTQVVATTPTTGNPVLIDFMFGDGRVLATAQTLEFARYHGWGGGPILENSLLDMYTDVLILQDSLPWGRTSMLDVLDQRGLWYDTIDSSLFGTFELASYRMVMLPSVQGDPFYGVWNANIGWISNYVAGGGNLWQSTANMFGTPTEASIPGGVIATTDSDGLNLIVDPAHPWVSGVPSPMSGTSASHETFSNLYPGSHVIATTQTSGLPVLVDFEFGSGRVMLTGQPLEYAWYHGQDGAPILKNSIVDMLNLTIFIDGFESGDVTVWSSSVP